MQNQPSFSTHQSIWDNIIDQNSLVDNLKSELATNSLTNVYFFCGPPGSGRLPIAKDFACSILCLTPLENGSACLNCNSCKMFAAQSHPDFHLIKTSGNIISIDTIRTSASLSDIVPGVSKRRILLIENADRLQTDSQNTLLKRLEDTPGTTIWILCAPSVNDVLPTIISRSRVKQLKQPDLNVIEDFLINSGSNAEKVKIASRLANGNIGLTKYLSQNPEALQERIDFAKLSVSIHRVSDVVFDVAQICKKIEKNAIDTVNTKQEEAKSVLRELLQLAENEPIPRKMNHFFKEIDDNRASEISRIKKDQYVSLVLDVMMVYRDISLIQSNSDSDKIINIALINEIQKYAKALTRVEIAMRIDKISMALNRLKTNVPEQLILENMFCELLVPERILQNN